MRLPFCLCSKYHRAAWSTRTAQNRKDNRKFFMAVFCYRCRVMRFIEHWKCQSCGFYFKPIVYAEHRKDCRLVIAATNINKFIEPTEDDFKYLYAVGAARGMTPPDVVNIARVEAGKSLAEFSKKEVIEFAQRIMGGDSCH